MNAVVGHLLRHHGGETVKAELEVRLKEYLASLVAESTGPSTTARRRTGPTR